eukprot:Pgem_evm1s4437
MVLDNSTIKCAYGDKYEIVLLIRDNPAILLFYGYQQNLLGKPRCLWCANGK